MISCSVCRVSSRLPFERTQPSNNDLAPQMQRHDLAQHMQEFTQMHMRYMADFLRGFSFNGIASKSLYTTAPPALHEDQGAAGAAAASCGGPGGSVSCSSNCAPCQSNEDMQWIREMDKRLVQQDHQIRYLTIQKETQVKEVTGANANTASCCLFSFGSTTAAWSHSQDVLCSFL